MVEYDKTKSDSGIWAILSALVVIIPLAGLLLSLV